MKIITAYDWQKWDGGERSFHYAFIQLTDEELSKMKKDIKCDSFILRDIVVYESIDDYKNNNITNQRKAALDKLTDYEKRLLNLV